MDAKSEELSILSCNAWLLYYDEAINVPKSNLKDVKLVEHSILACNAWLISYNETVNVP